MDRMQPNLSLTLPRDRSRFNLESWAVVGVAGATERIVSGQSITVDGYAGTVAIVTPTDD